MSLGNGAWFGALLGYTPPVQECETVADLAEWFELFSMASRVARARAARAVYNTPLYRAAGSRTEYRAWLGRTTPGVYR